MPRTATPPDVASNKGGGAAVHYRALEALYASAPVNALFSSKLEIVSEGHSRIRFQVDERFHHAAAAAQEEAAYTIFAAEEPDAEEVTDSPPVIAETRVDIPVVSVSDAVMLLDLRHTNALFFKNAGTGRHNMVYRRDDGSIGWVEPS